jgi:hypothetical protein
MTIIFGSFSDQFAVMGEDPNHFRVRSCLFTSHHVHSRGSAIGIIIGLSHDASDSLGCLEQD